MTKSFYEFDHVCEAMPDNVSFCKINGSISTQFTIKQITQSVGLQTATLWGFHYCPYCGEDMEGSDD